MSDAIEPEGDPAFDVDPISAKRLTLELLQAMGITRVINVDDEHFREPAQDLDTVVGALQAHAIDQALVARVLLDDEEDPTAGELDTDEVISLLREGWDDLSDDRKVDLTQAAQQAQDANEGPVETQSESLLGNNAALLALPELLDNSITFTTMTFAQWRDEGQAKLADGVSTLLLFDRSFEKENQSQTAGEELIKGVLLNDDFRHVRVGLLTHTASDADNERDIAAAIGASFGENQRSVVVVAKNRLSSDDTAFPEALRLVLFADELEAFRRHAIEALNAATRTETELLSHVDQYALMATFESARQEGLFETDNVTRMAKAPGVRELALRFRDPVFVEHTLSKLRNAAGIQLYFADVKPPPELAALLWQEKFDPKEHLESLSLPLEVGDVFRAFDLNGTGPDRYYVLLAQQCDLTIRKNGERTNDTGTFVLSKLNIAAIDEETGAYVPPKANQATIGQLDLDLPAPWYVNFATRLHVPALALDACVIDPGGMSVIGPNSAAPSALSASWLAKVKLMRRAAKAMLDRMKIAQESLAIVKGREAQGQGTLQQFAAVLAGGVAQGGNALTARISVEDQTVSYGIARHARIVGSAALALYALAAQHAARPAFDSDLFFEPQTAAEHSTP